MPVIAYMAVIFYLSSQSDPLPQLTERVWDKALHVIEFSGLAVLLARAFYGGGASLSRAVLAAIVASSLYAASDEIHQLWTQGREVSVYDWLAGSVGGGVGAALFSTAASLLSRKREVR